MCLCTPEIKTPFCGRPGCRPAGATLAVVEAAAPPPAPAPEEASPNAPWLALAHGICTAHGIPQGPIDARLLRLQDLLEGTLPCVPRMRDALMHDSPLVHWWPDQARVLLHGYFGPAELRGIALHMERHKG